MNIEATPSARARMRAAPRQCGEDCASGARNNYFIGKPMPPQSYQLEQRFLNGRRQLVNRAVLGWGVVYGFRLELGGADIGRLDEEILSIGEGLALDIVGRELWQPESISLSLDNLLVLDPAGRPLRADGELNDRFANLAIDDDSCWLLSAHYAERTLDPITLKDDCSCERKEWDRTCESIIYSLRQIDCADCCDPYRCALICECPPDSDCCGHENTPPTYADAKTDSQYEQEVRNVEAKYAKEIAKTKGDERAKLEDERARYLEELAKARTPTNHPGQTVKEPPRHARGGCTCLCTHLTGLPIGADCVRLRDVGDCTRADLDHGVSLSCLALGKDSCGNWTLAKVSDACGPRRLVKRNDLLFDLINGCDVTNIIETGWASWHRRDDPPVPFDEFAAAFGWVENEGAYAEYVTRDFWVRFSRPVRVASLKPDCFVLGIMREQAEGGWREYYRVPIVGVETEPEPGNPMLTKKATIIVGGAWLMDALVGQATIFNGGPTYVEISVRGDFIVDCMGQTVDANPRGLVAVPTGGDGPGDDYISTFTVARRESPPLVVRAAASTRRRATPTSIQGATP